MKSPTQKLLLMKKTQQKHCYGFKFGTKFTNRKFNKH